MASSSKPEGSMLWDRRFTGESAYVHEDIHTANERRLGEIIGNNVAGKLYTGRSRNEQVVGDTRMWLRDELRKIDDQLTSFLKLTAARAESEINYIMPGYTSCSVLSPSDGAIGCCHTASLSPTIWSGSELGFEGILWGFMGAVADRDFVSETPLPLKFNGVLSTITAVLEKMKASFNLFMFATDVADYLARNGVTFRETHHIFGRCVAKSEEIGIPMNEPSYETLKGIDERFEEYIAEVFNYKASVESLTAKGTASKAAVLEQTEVIQKMVK
ncbi:hypothetical protein AK830_g5341 [Neonectria ditissima]|uniref:Argininosuccinate lyase C-terminal domain-containing protein n=1 Tax=Neonectria ditissima TaxID=78410 RepID=A0A0P7B4C0_9HYPO|nr:hypothetical protein AK830_g5341 [Neonectria ditissima]